MNNASPASKRPIKTSIIAVLLLALGACALPNKTVRSTTYDFGPGSLGTAPQPPFANLPPLSVAEVESSPALESNAVLYRLAYADVQQLRPYAQARWSMSPGQLIRQRLRDQLGERRTLLKPGSSAKASASAATTPLTLRVELEEFSQLFDSPSSSVGLLRLRASVVQAAPGGERLVAQRMVVVQRPAPSADAPGGVRALTAATEAAVQELDLWLQGLNP